MREFAEATDRFATVRFERAALAVEVAETFTAAFKGVDAAEKALESIIKRSNPDDLDFWHEVFTAFTQIRG